MTQAKKLIEVAMPIREISAESVRDKSIRHGHISTLHLWWARRPLPVCRAVVFASLVPDPGDAACPTAFCDAVEELLGAKANAGDPYKPYDNIPYTKIVDPMEDSLRNRLLMFIGKFSDKYIQNEQLGKKTDAKDLLSDASLIKWDNKNNDEIISKARKLIWVAHNAKNGSTTNNLLADFDKAYTGIKDAEGDLYATADRHIESIEVSLKKAKLHDAIEAFLERMPRVFDPFAGGGAIPLEASRLGCRSFGNDINPVAHIIQKGGLEFPQKYGKPITYTTEEFVKRYGRDEYNRVTAENPLFMEKGKVRIDNRLAYDVGFYAKEIVRRAEAKIGHYYPPNDKGIKPIAYYWARIATCTNPSCRTEVPLLKGFYLSNKSDKKIHLKPIIKGKEIEFAIEKGEIDEPGWVHSRKNMRCPVCKNNTSNAELKQQYLANEVPTRLLAVIEDSDAGKVYRLPTAEEKQQSDIQNLDLKVPTEALPLEYTKAFDLCIWGFEEYGQMFSPRQLLAIGTFVDQLNRLKSELENEREYSEAVVVYLAMLINKIAAVLNLFGRWNVTGEKMETPFSKQAIPMTFDYPEGNPFSDSTGSAANQIDWILRYIVSESKMPFSTSLQNSSSGEKEQFPNKYLNAVVSDPPYYDAISYGDLSDFFYVWFKRTLGDVYPTNFATPQTPKSDECTAMKHHHANDRDRAKHHFENKLLQIFDAIEHQTSDIVSIMFAHQSTEAWGTLCNSILGARMNITGSWAIDTEMATRSLGLAGAVLASSVTVACKPAKRNGLGDYQEVKRAIQKKVEQEVGELYALGFRGADLLTACFGKAVGEFGEYESVEKASGDQVTVAELLKMTRECAFNALLKGFEGDDFTKFYIGWLELNGFVETDFDDAAQFTRVSMSVDVKELFDHNIFVKNGNKQTLSRYDERIAARKNLGESVDASLIDQVHRAMWLYKGGNRPALLKHIATVAAAPDASFWRVLTSLEELLPKGIDDEKQVAGLLDNKENLIRESQTTGAAAADQQGLRFE
jgi:putative DNA methylase